MIFIVSSDYDESTNVVIKWLIRYKQNVMRTGLFNWVERICISSKDGRYKVEISMSSGQKVNLNKVQAFWYRKSELSFFKNLELKLSDEYENVREEYIDYLENDELKALESFLVYLLESVPHIGNYNAKNGNKLIYFHEALKVGLNVPNFLLSTDKQALKDEFFSKESMIKPIQDLFYTYSLDGSDLMTKNYYSSTYKVEDFENFEENIFPTVVQSYIEKEIEIRSFYLKGEIYSMAIFSQLDEQTRVDFRNYNSEKPNRMVPFRLPDYMNERIDTLMKNLGLNTGSLDFILTKEGQYYFLEVNPAGQYGMIEEYCFYGLDKKIADHLIQKQQHYETLG